MLKKTITYKDFTDEEVTEDFYFHLSQAELIELEMSFEGGLEKGVEHIMKARDMSALVKEFKRIILSSYGVRSADGRRFIKNQEVRDEFVSTQAYSALFMELATDTAAAVAFLNGIVPAELAAEAARLTALKEIQEDEEKAKQKAEEKALEEESNASLEVAQNALKSAGAVGIPEEGMGDN